MCLLLILSIVSFSRHHSAIFSKEEAGKRIAQLLDDPKSKLKQIVVVGNEVIIVYEREYSLWY